MKKCFTTGFSQSGVFTWVGATIAGLLLKGVKNKNKEIDCLVSYYLLEKK
jgi:hypothetical protein